MIRYEPHPRWLSDIVRFPISYALRRALYGALCMAIYSTVLVLALEATLQVPLPQGATAFGVLGGVVSLALAFRLNNAYARWWEGRQQWGMLVNHSRNLAALTQALWPAQDLAGRRRMAGLIGDFAVGLSAHLRGELRVDELESLSSEESSIAARREHPLSYVSQLIWRELELRRADARLDTGQLLLLGPHASALLDILGACERIRNTPIPFAVTAAARLFMFLFTALVPLGLYGEFGRGAIPIAVAAYFFLAVMDVLAAELENPFGIDCNDLPTRSIAEMIRRQVHELVDVERQGAPDQQPRQPAPFSKFF